MNCTLPHAQGIMRVANTVCTGASTGNFNTARASGCHCSKNTQNYHAAMLSIMKSLPTEAHKESDDPGLEKESIAITCRIAVLAVCM